jgi:hypothetical protein
MEFRDKQIAPPKSWVLFEDLCLSLFKAVWNDKLAQKNGRSGQPQHGVDIFGSPGRTTAIHGVQCKGKDQTYGHKPTLRELRREIKKAEYFEPALEHWVLATTAPKEGGLQVAAREISKNRAARNQFTVTVLGWEDIRGLLADHPAVAEAFYPEHAFDVRSILDALKGFPRSEDLRAFMALLTTSGNQEVNSSPVWMPVQFEQTRDLGPALMGRPLGPADVAACPLLPEAQALVLELERAFAVRLLGEPGAGKSVCALQAARILALKGWHVVRLLDPAVSNLDINPKDKPTLFIVDDAHLIPPKVLKTAEENASPVGLLLTTHNAFVQSGLEPGTIRLDAKRAVKVIAAGLRSNLSNTLKVVRRIDDQVGDRPSDEPIDQRLENAEQRADRPWQFCFILGGGWRRAEQAADNARAIGADIVLAALAARQIASRDARCTLDALLSLLTHAILDEPRTLAALDWLVRQRLVILHDDLRCPHQRFAVVVLERVLNGQGDKGRRAIARLLSAILNDCKMPVAGLCVLLRELKFAGEFARWTYLVSAQDLQFLIKRCWSASSGEDRMYALFVFNQLDRYITGWPQSVLDDRIDELTSWIADPIDPIGFGAGALMNDIWNHDGDFATSIVRRINPAQIAAALSAATPTTASSLASLMQGIRQWKSPDWNARFLAALDRASCLKLAANWPEKHPMSAFVEFCKVLASETDDFALDLVEAFLPRTVQPLTEEPIQTFHELHDLAWVVLRVLDPFGNLTGHLAPSNRMRSLARRMCSPLRPSILAEKLSSLQKRDFQISAFLFSFLQKAAPGKFRATVAALDWSKIESTIGDDWTDLFHDAQVFLRICFSEVSAGRLAVETMIQRNLHRIVYLPPRLVLMAPNAGYKHIKSGKLITLARFGHFHWQEAACVLLRFAMDRPCLVERLLAPHEQAAGAVLSNKHPSWYQSATDFIHIVRQLADASFQRMLSAVDVAIAEEGWAATLAAKGKGRRAVALLIDGAIERDDALGTMARRLRHRFPQRSRPVPEDLELIDFSEVRAAVES